jgi:hypothetical protein
MGWRTTLSLSVVVGVLGLALWLTDQKPSDKGNVEVRLLSGRTLGRATKIRWEASGAQPIEIRRTPGGPFRLAEPIEDLASGAHLLQLANCYDGANLHDEQVEDNAANRARYGFDPPRLVLEVTFEDGTSQRIEIGKEGRRGNDVYVRRDGRIYAGGTALWSSLQGSVNDLREHGVFRTAPGDVADLTIDQVLGSGRSLLRLSCTGSDWQLLAPVKGRADPQVAAAFAMQVLGLHIDEFAAGNYRLPDRPADVVVTIVRRSGGEDKVSMWRQPDGGLIGELPDRKVTFALSATQVGTTFEVAADQLRARVLFPGLNVHTDPLQVIVDPGEGNGPRIVLNRDSVESVWALMEPVVSPANPTPVQMLLTAINDLRALQFYPGTGQDPRFGLRGNGLQVGVRPPDHKQPMFVRLGSDTHEGEVELTYAARTDALDEVVGVPKAAVDLVRTAWTSYVALEVLDLKQTVQQLRLERRGGQTRILRRKEQGWSADGEAAVHDDTGDVVDEIRDLHGKRAIGTEFEKLGDPDWYLDLCRDNGDSFVKLSFWDHGAQPLLVAVPARRGLAFELSALHSKMLRGLWQ